LKTKHKTKKSRYTVIS